MFIVIKSEHYDCTNLICKKDTLEEAVAAVKDSMAQRINKNYHAGLTGTDITHENEDHYGFSFTFDENRHAESSEPRAYSTYDYWNGDDQESVEWVVYEVTTDKPFFLLSYEEYESIKLTGFYDTFDEAFGKMKELIAESVNDVFDEDATADDVEDIVRKPSPKNNSVTFLPEFFFKISIISFTASALHPNLKTLWSSWKTLSFPTTNRSSMWLQTVWKLWGFQSRRVITTRTTSPPLMCQSSLSASITLF